jgi:hypothetical protein
MSVRERARRAVRNHADGQRFVRIEVSKLEDLIAREMRSILDRAETALILKAQTTPALSTFDITAVMTDIKGT